MSKYLEFQRLVEEMIVLNKKTKTSLGRIIYYKPWKQYVFEPKHYTVFNDECLEDIVNQIKAMNAEGVPK